MRVKSVFCTGPRVVMMMVAAFYYNWSLRESPLLALHSVAKWPGSMPSRHALESATQSHSIKFAPGGFGGLS